MILPGGHQVDPEADPDLVWKVLLNLSSLLYFLTIIIFNWLMAPTS